MLASFDISGFCYDPDPKKMIRVSNHFYNLGHADCIEGLRRFADRYVAIDDSFDHAEKIDVVVPLLFRPKSENAKLPNWDYGKSNKSYKLTLDRWPTTIYEFHGIPFETEFRRRGGSGIRIANLYLIEWAENDAEMRDSPLTPRDNPLENLDELVSSVLNLDYLAPYRENNTDTEESVRRTLRSQLYNLVHELIDDPEFPAPENWMSTDENWSKVISYFQTCDTRWNPSAQSYSMHKNAE